MDKQITKHIIIHKNTNVTAQVTDILPNSKIISNINTSHKLSLINLNVTKINKINFSRNNTEGFKDMNMVLNKIKHIIQQRVGYKDKDKLVTIYIRMDKLIIY